MEQILEIFKSLTADEQWQLCKYFAEKEKEAFDKFIATVN
jgi:hypothetical protein